MTHQLKKLLQRFKEEAIESLIVTKDINISYLTNFNSQDSWAIITSKNRIYITDFRYLEEAKSGLKDFSVHKINGSIFETVAVLADKLRIKNLHFEAKNISYAEADKIKSYLKARKISFKPTFDFIELIRLIKSSDEISKIKRAVALNIEAFSFARSVLRPGIRESEVAVLLESFIRKRGAKLAFDPIVASGINSSYPHAKITNRVIAKNDAVTVDMGVDVDGYKSDLTRVFFLGRIPLSLRRIYDIVLKAQIEAIKKIKAGTTASEVDKSARNFIGNNKLGQFFGHALGHGIGREVHEAPSISSGNDMSLEEGMVFTVEPAIYIPGKFGVRIEDIALVKNEGCEVLSDDLDKSN